jgi:hypothetical protein
VTLRGQEFSGARASERVVGKSWGQNKEVPVAANFPLSLRALKGSIKKVVRSMDIPVRFDPALDGGFVVRKAMVDEAVKGDRQGARLGEAKRSRVDSTLWYVKSGRVSPSRRCDSGT